MSLLLLVESSQEPTDSLDHENQCRNDHEGTSRVASSIIAHLYADVSFSFWLVSNFIKYTP